MLTSVRLEPTRTVPQPAGDMLGAGGTCEFSSQTLQSDRRGAHVSPATGMAGS